MKNLDINKLQKQVRKYITIRMYIVFIFFFILIFAYQQLLIPTTVLIALLVGALIIHDKMQEDLLNNGEE